MKVTWVVSLLFLTLILQIDAIPRFANYIQDHMVLQRAPQRAIVWGFGDASQLTILQINEQIYQTISNAEPANHLGESIWSITLDPVFDEGPFDIHVSQPLANGTLVTITLHDVLFGDVWLCSGQSNMQMSVIDIFNGTEEIANAGNYPKVRVFTAARKISHKPLEELINITQNWSVASPESIGGPSFQYMSAVCWLYGRMIHTALGGRPIGLVNTCANGTIIEFWSSPQALQDCGIPLNGSAALQLDEQSFEAPPPPPTDYTVLYNSMIFPFTRMVIYGVIWYQGESNSAINLDNYTCTFSNLIKYWRQTWYERTNGTTDLRFPFGFVQLATDMNNTIGVGGFPWIRWHQTFDVGYVPNNVVPNVFMAVALDLRDDHNGVHPRYKHDVGYRLSRSGLAIAYGQKVEFQGPLVSNVTYSPGDALINISYTAVTDIELRNPNGFAVCCQASNCSFDHSWLPANITNKIGLTITLTIPDECTTQRLYGLRYLWHETPCIFKQAAIYSATDSNLPSPPYMKLF